MALGRGNVEIDLHGLRAEEAKKRIDKAIRDADPTVPGRGSPTGGASSWYG